MLFLCILLCAAFSTAISNESTIAVTSANNDFSVDLYKALSNETGNLVVSPLSVGALLSLVYLGAGGNTAAQLKAALHLPDDPELVSDGFKTLMENLKSSSPKEARIANRIYLDENFILKGGFRKMARTSFKADVIKVDFAKNTEESRKTINTWVEKRTKGKIRDLFEQDDVSHLTKMVLVNAIYFKGMWKEPFSKKDTNPGTFHLANNSKKTVLFMQQTKSFRIGKISSLKTQILEMPYSDGNFNFWVLLPDAVDGLEMLEAGLGQIDFPQLSKILSPRPVNIALPKFQIQKKCQLVKTLMQLNVKDIFSNNANLTGITRQNVKVDRVIQKAFIEVTEKGTVAAAASGGGFVFYSAAPRPVEFKVDRPFMFVLLDRSFSVWFIGRVESPA